jgi:hypothetical protein
MVSARSRRNYFREIPHDPALDGRFMSDELDVRIQQGRESIHMMWLNREYYCNLYVNRDLVGHVSRSHGPERGWLVFLLDKGQITERIGWFASAEEARMHAEASVPFLRTAVA